MIARASWLLLCFVLAVACVRGSGTTVVPPSNTAERKTLGPGDVLEIRVTDRDELSGPYEVSDAGTIRFPLIGDIEVQQKTQGQIAAEIEAKLADGWFKQPQVAVRVTERQNREVSVLGQVKEAGSYPFKPGLTVMQAISLAGGMNPLAMPRRVKLIRETENGRQTYEIDTTAILESRAQDLALEPGDIVFVPESPV